MKCPVCGYDPKQNWKREHYDMACDKCLIEKVTHEKAEPEEEL